MSACYDTPGRRISRLALIALFKVLNFYKAKVNGPGDGLNAGHRAERLHGIVKMPINAALRYFKDLADLERALAGGAPRQAFQLSFC